MAVYILYSLIIVCVSLVQYSKENSIRPLLVLVQQDECMQVVRSFFHVSAIQYAAWSVVSIKIVLDQSLSKGAVNALPLSTPNSPSSTPFLVQKLSHHLVQFSISPSNIHSMMTTLSASLLHGRPKTDLSVNILNLNPLTFSCVNLSSRLALFI
jgi:hypothetical protein